MSDIDWNAYKAKIVNAARAGLIDASPIFRDAAEQKARDTFPGVTHATFEGIYATVSGDPGAFAIEQTAIQEVLLLNPGHAYTESADEPSEGVIRLYGSVPTDYIDQLEADPGHAFLARTLDETQGSIKAAVDRAIGGAT